MPKKRSRSPSPKPSKKRKTEKGECDFNDWLHGKIFNDPIHETIRLHPVSVAIIDTPQFQRLRNIKQLGGAYFVYPGASHNRFEHSIGVAYLAGQFVRRLGENQPDLEIDAKDVLGAEIAGLCHDLGHGPFSHLFDKMFIPRIKPKPKWKHEQSSLNMFDHIISSNNKVEGLLDKYGFSKKDKTFIKEMILGKPLDRNKFRGRPRKKWFLYEIVANNESGIDVDKWDYFARDSYMLGMKCNFSHTRYMEMARVITDHRKKHICVRDKEAQNIYDMFHIRAELHRRAYQHTVTVGIELMIVDVLVKANDHFLIPGREREVKMSECIEEENIDAYCNLDDSILPLISLSKEEKLKGAKTLMERIKSRDLYKCVVRLPCKSAKDDKEDEEDGDEEDEDEEDEEQKLRREILKEKKLEEDDFVISKQTFDYGNGSENPIKRVKFYKKDSPDEVTQLTEDQMSKLWPKDFKESHWLVYSTNPGGESQRILEKCVKRLQKTW